MTALAQPTAIEQAKSGGITHVDSDTLRQLADWVENIASPEDLAWNSDRFKEVRDWLKQHKAAKAMRIAAVRVECISLRKIALAGLTHKLTVTNDRKAAEYFQKMGDADFASFLSDTEAETSPWVAAKRRIEEEGDVDDWFTRRNTNMSPGAQDVAENLDKYGDAIDLTEAARDVLSVVAEESESFTVADAAQRLYENIASRFDCERNSGDRFMPNEMAGEPLREVVRRVLRTPGPEKWFKIDGESVHIPHHVTFATADGDYHARIPWDLATLAQLHSMVVTREQQAADLAKKAAGLRLLHKTLEKHSEADSDRVNSLTVKSGVKEPYRNAEGYQHWAEGI